MAKLNELSDQEKQAEIDFVRYKHKVTTSDKYSMAKQDLAVKENMDDFRY